MQKLRIALLLMFAVVIIGEASQQDVDAKDVFVETRGCKGWNARCYSNGVSKISYTTVSVIGLEFFSSLESVFFPELFISNLQWNWFCNTCHMGFFITMLTMNVDV